MRVAFSQTVTHFYIVYKCILCERTVSLFHSSDFVMCIKGKHYMFDVNNIYLTFFVQRVFEILYMLLNYNVFMKIICCGIDFT